MKTRGNFEQFNQIQTQGKTESFLATSCLVWLAGWNIYYKCWRSEIDVRVSRSLKRCLSWKILCPVQVISKNTFTSRCRGQYRTVTYSWLVQLELLHVQIVICHSIKLRTPPKFTTNMQRPLKCARAVLIKPLKFFFGFTTKKGNCVKKLNVTASIKLWRKSNQVVVS